MKPFGEQEFGVLQLFPHAMNIMHVPDCPIRKAWCGTVPVSFKASTPFDDEAESVECHSGSAWYCMLHRENLVSEYLADRLMSSRSFYDPGQGLEKCSAFVKLLFVVTIRQESWPRCDIYYSEQLAAWLNLLDISTVGLVAIMILENLP